MFWIFVISALFIFAKYEPGNECRICLNDIKSLEYTNYFLCDHHDIHWQCLTSWVSKKRSSVTCPVCRALPMMPYKSLPCYQQVELQQDGTIMKPIDVIRLSSLDGNTNMIKMALDYCYFSESESYLIMDFISYCGHFDTLSYYVELLEDLDFHSLRHILKRTLEKNHIELFSKLLYRSRHTIIKERYGQPMWELGHMNCILFKNWECSDALSQFYIHLSEPANIGRILLLALTQKIPVKNLDILLRSRNSFITIKCYKSSLTTMTIDWHTRMALWTFMAANQTFEFLRDLRSVMLVKVLLYADTRSFEVALQIDKFSSIEITNAIDTLHLHLQDSAYIENSKVHDHEQRITQLRSFL